MNPDGTVNVIERVSESERQTTPDTRSYIPTETIEPPENNVTPDTRIIPIDGIKHVVTREASGEWGKPVVWGPSVGDEVELGLLKKGDRILIEGVYREHDEHNKIGILFPKMRDKLKWLKAHDIVTYNGKSES